MTALQHELRAPFPNVDVQTKAEYGDSRRSFLDQFLNIFVALLLLSELIAVLGIVNTLMLSVYERTRELGLLRTVGTTRRQVWGMVSGESVIIAVLGCVVGIGVGLLWGWGVMTVLKSRFTDDLVIPVGQLGWFVLASVGRRVRRRAAARRGTRAGSTCSRRSPTSDAADQLRTAAGGPAARRERLTGR